MICNPLPDISAIYEHDFILCFNALCALQDALFKALHARTQALRLAREKKLVRPSL